MKKRIFLMADYPVGVQIIKFLKEQNEQVVGLAVHPPRLEHAINRGCTKEIINASELTADVIFDGEEIKNGQHLESIRALKPDLILCVFWSFILQPELIAIPPQGCINFHCAYLPYNRGANPNVWPIIEGTPAGATLHYIDPGVDSGRVIAQEQVPVESIDTAATLYQKIVDRFFPLFREIWPTIKDGTAPHIEQDLNKKTFHRRKDLQTLDMIDLNKQYSARELINLIRARTFAPFPSAHFIDDQGRKVGIRVSLEYID